MGWIGINDFSPREFDSPDAPGSGWGMKVAFLRRLQAVRTDCGFPLVVASGFRTVEHNKAVGGEPLSAHLIGEAVDFRAYAPRTRYMILAAAMRQGFNRIGIGDSFIHLDESVSLDQNVVWVYPTGTKKG